jgi:hypothetical protein
MRRLPDFHSDVDVDNYSPQVERLLAEWDQERALFMMREAHSKKAKRRSPNRRRVVSPKTTRSGLSTA